MDAENLSSSVSKKISEEKISSLHKDGINLLGSAQLTKNIKETTADGGPEIISLASGSAPLTFSDFLKSQYRETPMQDIGEQSKIDLQLQSGFNTISESFKTLNEEPSKKRSITSSTEDVQFKKEKLDEKFGCEEKKTNEEIKEIEENISFEEDDNETANLEAGNTKVVKMGLEIQKHIKEINFEKLTEHKIINVSENEVEKQAIEQESKTTENVDKKKFLISKYQKVLVDKIKKCGQDKNHNEIEEQKKTNIIQCSQVIENKITNQNEDTDNKVKICGQENTKTDKLLDTNGNKVNIKSFNLDESIERKSIYENQFSKLVKNTDANLASALNDEKIKEMLNESEEKSLEDEKKSSDEKSEVSDLEKKVILSEIISKEKKKPNDLEKFGEDLITEADNPNVSNDMKEKCIEANTTVAGTMLVESVETERQVKQNNSDITRDKTKELFQKRSTESEEITIFSNDDNTINVLDKIDEIKEDEISSENLNSNLIKLSLIEGKQSDRTDKNEFYNKECINYECQRACKLCFIAPMFVLNYYKVNINQNNVQYVCDDCYEFVVSKYDEWCNIMVSHQPLFMANIPKPEEIIEIHDSTDEDDESSKNGTGEYSDFSKDSIDLIQNELDNVISDVMGGVDIQKQLNWSKTLMQHRLAKLKEDNEWITDTLSSLEKNVTQLNRSLYQMPKIDLKLVTPLDLNTGKKFHLGESTENSIPPIGEVERPTIEINGNYYAAKNKVTATWFPVKVVEKVDPPTNVQESNMEYYKVEFIKVPTFKTVPAKHLAYFEMPSVQLSLGARVIAFFDASLLCRGKNNNITDVRSAFYPGVIAEVLQSFNNYRYLIFFDDGYTQYVRHRNVRLICEASVNVWEDIQNPGSKYFIQNYLIKYSTKNRPMVNVKRGQSMITELNGKWIYAKVIDIDASLIQVQFEGQKNYKEWIYRGSTRLGPIFKVIHNLPFTRPSIVNRSQALVSYTQDDGASKQENETTAAEIRSVAKKSVTKTDSQELISKSEIADKSLTESNSKEREHKVLYYSSKLKSNPPPKTFKPHTCSSSCITREHFNGNYGVLSKPLLNSWERSIYKIKNKKTNVVYRAPCGRSLRNIKEVHQYLRMTNNKLNVESFAFDYEVGCLNGYKVQSPILKKTDISEGREKIPIECVNYYDHTMPLDCDYSAERIPTEGVKLNTDPEFLVGCDCDDDCTDRSKCTCWQLTLEGAKYGNPGTPIDYVGYQYKRLLENVPTAIYECNVRCKCSSKCINRVVQQPLDTNIQVFKTLSRGWGLRCLNDIPKGAFVCTYAGNLLTGERADATGEDEYYAELDYIEVTERFKEGYETDIEEDSDEYVPENDLDEGSPVAKSRLQNESARFSTSNVNTKNRTTGDDDEQERQTINFAPNTELNDANIKTKYRSTRRFYGKNESPYVMDARSIGNVGRYFNHSCSPNMFVQNVFVDTHDLRFPWIAFFANHNIRAGTELTWNYMYEVGVVQGKVLFCLCGTENCRKRLL